MKELSEGDHFGEVSIIFECAPTATVTSLNYNTFAVMTAVAYKRLVQEYPEYEE